MGLFSKKTAGKRAGAEPITIFLERDDGSFSGHSGPVQFEGFTASFWDEKEKELTEDDGEEYEPLELNLDEVSTTFDGAFLAKTAGFTLHDGPSCTSCIALLQPVLLMRERSNPVDPNAVRVACVEHSADHHLGYLTAEMAAELVALDPKAKGWGATIVQRYLADSKVISLHMVGSLGRDVQFTMSGEDARGLEG